MAGHYVAFEGIEGTGKSTIASMLTRRLRRLGHDVVAVREPGGTPAGEQIRNTLLHDDLEIAPWTEAMLMAASRAQLIPEVVAPALESGAWVVSDRSAYSSLAYQGGGRRLGIEAVRAVNDAALGGLWPELVVMLEVDVEVGLARQRVPDRIGSAGFDFQKRVAEAFRELAVTDAERVVAIDASGALDDVFEAVVAVVEARW